MFRPRLVLGGADGDRTPVALALLLTMLTDWNVYLMHVADRPFPPLATFARYQRENYSSEFPEDWRDALQVLEQGGGDCEDLACYRAAELRHQGEPARAVFFDRILRNGSRMFHIFVQRADGSLEDPSRALGMTAEE